MERINETISPYLSFLDNEYISGFIILFIILYASLIAPKLPSKVVAILNHPIAKFLMLFLIVFMAKKNVALAIVIAVAFVISLRVMHKYIRDVEPLSTNEEIIRTPTYDDDVSGMDDTGILEPVPCSTCPAPPTDTGTSVMEIDQDASIAPFNPFEGDQGIAK